MFLAAQEWLSLLTRIIIPAFVVGPLLDYNVAKGAVDSSSETKHASSKEIESNRILTWWFFKWEKQLEEWQD